MFVSNVFNVVSALRLWRIQGPPGGAWNRPGPASAGVSCLVTYAHPHSDTRPLPQDILRYTMSSTLLLQLVSTHAWGVS